jgi:hypothetical protein
MNAALNLSTPLPFALPNTQARLALPSSSPYKPFPENSALQAAALPFATTAPSFPSSAETTLTQTPLTQTPPTAPVHQHHHEAQPAKGLTLQKAYNIGSALTLTQLVDKLPVPAWAASSALISRDPRLYAKLGLGLFAVNQTNQALGWAPPPLALAVETSAVIHMLMLGVGKKSLLTYALMLPLILTSVAATQGAHSLAEKYMKQRPNWDEKTKTALDLGSRLLVAGVALGASIAVFPRLYLQAAKHHWLGAEEAKQAIERLTFVAGTPEAKTYLKSLGNAHHRDAVAKSKSLLQGLEADIAKLTQPLQQLVRQLKPEVQGLGQNTAQDFKHFAQVRHLVSDSDKTLQLGLAEKSWQEAPLKRLHDIAVHQLEKHQPIPFFKTPFFSLLGTQGAAITCYNGCCVGSLFCLADVADMAAVAINNLTPKAASPKNRTST